MAAHAGFRVVLACALFGCEAPAPKTPPVAPGELIGRVEISEDVPISTCRALLEGTPLGSRCDETGEFDIKRVPPGRWNLRIISDGADDAQPTRRVAAGANPGQVTDLGPVRLSKPGSIGGRLRSLGGHDLARAILTVPGLGAVTAPSASGGYLLEGVSPGLHDVVLLLAEGQVIRTNVNVQPSKVTVGVDFDVGMASPAQVSVHGIAGRADGSPAGITVELVESLDGKVVTSAVTDENGAFSLGATQGVYIVRAREAANSTTAIIPSLVVRGTNDIELTTALVLPAPASDLDGDGRPDSSDTDADGDGVPNSDDAFPFDPAEVADTDKDGVGDRADLRSQGGASIDRQSQTPDGDGDGKFDFEDNCPSKSNPQQEDNDGDGPGDACDNCPYVENADQRDSLGNGTGDACRTCHFNTDCPGGLLCQNGLCLECISNRQCGDKVCDPTTHKCTACKSTSECSQPDKCDLEIGRCVACLANADCGPNMTCTFGQCFPQCTSDASCPGQYCVDGVCVGCRTNVDCPLDEWCDNGLCRPQCVVNGDCTQGRSCDTMTGTCVLPCNGLCVNGQTCSSMVCRDVCDVSRPCSTGSKCAAGACVPECAVDNDCLTVRPFTICQAGQCVPNNLCVIDSDCDRNEMCVTGICVARPTAEVIGKGFACNDPCQCRMDEACLLNTSDGMNYCVVERVPKWFAGEPGAAECTGGGDGRSPATCTTDLLSMLSGAQSGDLVAAKAPTSANIFGGLINFQIVLKAGVNLTGGYKVCGPNRWVRDPAAHTIVQSNILPVVSIPGTSGSPRDGVTLRNFEVRPVGGGSFINATFASRLTLANLIVGTSASTPQTAFSCDTCADLDVSNLDVNGVNAFANVTLVTLNKVSGKVDRLHGGAAVGLATYKGINATNTVGPLEITNTTLEAVGASSGSQGIVVDTAAGGPLTISGSQIVPYAGSGNDNSNWYGIAVKRAPSFTVSNNIINGVGVTEPSLSSENRYYFYFEDSNGTASGNSIVWPTFTNIGIAIGYYVFGPNGGVVLDNDSASGGAGAGSLELVRLQNITSGTPVVSRGNFSQSLTGGTANYGVHAINLSTGGFVVTDSTFQVGDATGGTHRGASLEASVGRIERSKLIMGTGGHQWAANVTGASQIELYDNFLHGGRGGSSSIGLLIEAASSVWAVSNTIDGGGLLNSAIPTRGIGCDGGSIGYFTSNLVSGGYGTTSHNMLLGDSTACTDSGAAGNFKNNYFWYPAVGGHGAGELVANVVGAAVGVFDGNGNIINDNVGCYDTTGYPPPFYRITAGSPCVDKGPAAPKRKDLSNITSDVDGNARVLGGISDIGCHEKQ